jgi:hypothetical protein
MKPEHSKLPWRLATEKTVHGFGPALIIRDAQLFRVCEAGRAMLSDGGVRKDHPKVLANANLIIRAVNNRAALVEALERFYKYALLIGGAGLPYDSIFREAVVNARAAIANATQQSGRVE